MSSFSSVFPPRALIGMVHFAPLPGYPDSPGYARVLELALADLAALEAGGAQAVLLENNYDVPHARTLSSGAAADFLSLARELRARTKLPLGVCCLWNDWKSALRVAKEAGCQFVRAPVFVDRVRTHYGFDIAEDPAEILRYRREIGAENVLLFADVRVKHCVHLLTGNAASSALQAKAAGADAVIVTGKWTGDAPVSDDLAAVRAAVGDFPVLVGSGADATNAASMLASADALIVGTSLKTRKFGAHAANVVGWEERIDAEKVRALAAATSNP